MKNFKTYAAYALSVLVVCVMIGAGVNAFSGEQAPTTVIEHAENVTVQAPMSSDEGMVGAVAGPDVYGDFRVHGALTSGNGILSLATSTGTTVLTTAQLMNNSLLEITVNTGATATLTLPATSTLSGLLDPGASRKWMIHNATSSTMALTIGAGAGMDLIGVTTNDDVIDETEYSELECIRQLDTDWTCRVSELLHVD